MSILFDAFKRCNPIIVSSDWRAKLESAHKSINPSWREHMYRRRIFCSECHQSHQVQQSQSYYFYICPENPNPHRIKIASLKSWKLDSNPLLSCIGSQLGIKTYINELVPNQLWKLGELRLNDKFTHVSCVLIRRVTPQTLHWAKNHAQEANLLIITIGDAEWLKMLIPQMEVLDIYEIFDPSSGNLKKTYFSQWVHTRFQRLVFDINSGDLWLDQKRVVTIQPSSPQYFFVLCLWENFNQPVSHEDIFQFCGQKLSQRDEVMEWYTEYIPASFCHAMKREVVNKAVEREVCSMAIQPHRTNKGELAYRLIAPPK